MSKWIIESMAGVPMGMYAGKTPKDAFLAMLEEAGEASAYGEPHVGTEADYHINPYEGVLWIHDSGCGTEAIKAGVEAAHQVFERRGVSPRAAWEAAQAHADGRPYSARLLSAWEDAEMVALQECCAGEHGVLVLEGW
jgi:hypothetical protein